MHGDERDPADEPFADEPLDSPPTSASAADAAFEDIAGIFDDPAATGAPQSAPDSEERVTEWFSVEEDFLEDDGPAPLPRRDHHVTAVVVSHDGAVWLPAVLTTLAAQTRLPDTAVGVDTGSVDGSSELMVSSFGLERTVALSDTVGFGEAVATGLAHIDPRGHEPFGPDVVSWVWLLHDDSAPDPGCLEALLSTADDHPSAAVVGPKILGWHDRRLLLEAGVTVNGAGRRITGLERREHDQGQHDGVRDVLAVSSAGMLVRRDVWDALHGFDPALRLFRDDLDFCWRAQRMGERVIVATDAVLHHREASAHGRRIDDIAPRPQRADREASVHVLLSQASTLAAPFVAARLILGSLVRALLYLLGKDVGAARDEVAAVWGVATHPASLRASRANVARTSAEPASVVKALRPTAWQQARAGLEAFAGVLTTSGASAPSASVSALDSGPVGDDADFMADGSSGLLRRIVSSRGVLLTAALVVVAVAGTRGLWLGDGVLQGGALLPPPPGSSDLWETYRQAWHDVGPGSTTPAPPYLVPLALLAWLLLGKAPVAVTVVLLLGIPIAGWAAYFSLRGWIASRWVRVWAGAAYALLPAVTGAVSAGRIGLMIAAIALPFTVRSFVRISRAEGTLRRSAGTALLVAIVLAAAPAIWVALLLLGIGASIHLLRTRGAAARPVLARLAVALLAPLVLLLPWSLYLLSHPALLLLGPGLNDVTVTDPGLRPYDVLLLHPGGPGMTPIWLTIGILVGGLLALLRSDRLRALVPFAALAAIALAIGLLQSLVMVTPPGATVEVRPWAGPATLLMGACLIAMAAIGVDGLRERFAGASFTLSQPLAFGVAILAVASALLSAGWFVAGLTSVVRKAPATSVPAFVAADAEGPQAPRTLVLAADVGGRITYSLVNGAGPKLGDADVSPPASAWQQLDPYVAALASGRGGEEIEALAGYGIRYVLLAPGAPSDVVPTLDGEPGLRRLSNAEGTTLWRVAGTTARARVVSRGKPEAVGIAENGRVTADPYIDQEVGEGAGRILVSGAAADGSWSAPSPTS